MKRELPLSKCSDSSLLEELSSLVTKNNALTARLLAYIAEVDHREIYRREACPSMYAYCVERLHLSEGAAYKRIHAARAARRFPVIFGMVERGEIHLKGIVLLAPHLTGANHRALLERARHQPARAIEKIVAEVAPRPDVTARVRKLPEKTPTDHASHPASPASGGGDQGCELPRGEAPRTTSPSGGGGSASELCAPLARPSEREAVVAPLSPQRYEIRVTVGEETYADLKQLQDLLAHQVPSGDPAEILSRALALLLEKTLARKTGVTDRPRKAKPQKKRSRHIPAEVRRQVWLRDKGRCAFRDTKGRRCSCTRGLEYHHIDNWARGAEHDPHRIELRCLPHNAYQAELDYGEAFTRNKRAGKQGAKEGTALYEPVTFPGARARPPKTATLARAPKARLTGPRQHARGRAATTAPH